MTVTVLAYIGAAIGGIAAAICGIIGLALVISAVCFRNTNDGHCD